MSSIPQFDRVFDHVIGVEGRYSNNPNDSGGETMFGITLAVARAYNYVGPMRAMPLDMARSIYKMKYWDALGLDVLSLTAPALAHELFDSGVNCGIGNAGKWLQVALNSLNKRGSLFGDLLVDGQPGPVTRAAFYTLAQLRGKKQAETAVRRLCDAQQGCYYLELSQRREKDEDFMFGWAMNRLGELT